MHPSRLALSWCGGWEHSGAPRLSWRQAPRMAPHIGQDARMTRGADSLIPTTGSASPHSGHGTGLARTPRCVLTPGSPPENLSTPTMWLQTRPLPGRDPGQQGPGTCRHSRAHTGSAGPARTRRLSQQRPDLAGKSPGPGVQGPGFECCSPRPSVPGTPALPSVSHLWPPSRRGPARPERCCFTLCLSILALTGPQPHVKSRMTVKPQMRCVAIG